MLLETRKELYLILPLNLAAVMPTECEVLRPIVWKQLELYLRARDKELRTISRTAARQLWLESIQKVRASEGGARAGYDDAARVLAHELRKHAEFDAIIAPSLFVREAVVTNRTARWDGVEQKVGFSARGVDARRLAETPLEGVAPAASLHVAVFDAEGEKLHEALGGLDVLVRVRAVADNLRGKPNFEFVPRTDLLEDLDAVRRGIAVAFDPFLPPPPG